MLVYKYGSWWHLCENVTIWNSTFLTCGRKTNFKWTILLVHSCILISVWKVIPLILSSWFEHCTLQAPPTGFLASQTSTSQWTYTYKTEVYGYCYLYLQFVFLNLKHKTKRSTRTFILIAEVTWWLKLSLSWAKANIGTSKRLKFEGYWTLASGQTGWKITWCGSLGFAQLWGKKQV